MEKYVYSIICSWALADVAVTAWLLEADKSADAVEVGWSLIGSSLNVYCLMKQAMAERATRTSCRHNKHQSRPWRWGAKLAFIVLCCQTDQVVVIRKELYFFYLNGNGSRKEKIQKTKVKQNDLNLVIWPVSKTLLKQQYVLSKQTVYLCDCACQSAFLQMLICVQRAEGDEKLTCEEWIQVFFF